MEIGIDKRMSVGKKKALVLAAMLAALAVPACSTSATKSASNTGSTTTQRGVSGSAPSQASGASRPATTQVVTVTVDAAGFRPKDVRMAPGTNVIWIQADGGPHVIVSGGPGHEDGKFRSLSMKKDSSFTIVARSPGTYQYFDQLHPSLTAQFVVAGGSASPHGGKSP
jgi:plastocyanin